MIEKLEEEQKHIYLEGSFKINNLNGKNNNFTQNKDNKSDIM